jgi:O-methyltransferase
MLFFASFALIVFQCWCRAIPLSKQFQESKKIYLKGPDYSIFGIQNIRQNNSSPLLGSPEKWLSRYKKSFARLKELARFDEPNPQRHAARLYLKLLQGILSANVYESEDIAVSPKLGNEKLDPVEFDRTARSRGADWSTVGVTMIGTMRLNNLHELLLSVIDRQVEGGFMETGVWRGGASIFAKGVLMAYGQLSRKVFVCDSFRGLPPSVWKKDAGIHWDNTPILEVSEQEVIKNFDDFSLLDSNVVFVKGFFNASMPPLRLHKSHYDWLPPKLAVLRLDGDMYQSTLDVMYHMYDRVSVGGFVIVDDWFGFPARDAVTDFFKEHGKADPEIIAIDDMAVYWQKKNNFVVNTLLYKMRRIIEH